MAEGTNADGVLDENDEYVLINGTNLPTDRASVTNLSKTVSKIVGSFK